MTVPQSDDFLPSASIDTLKQRAVILGRCRKFFDRRGFFEVHTPVLSRDTVVDRFIEPISVELSVGGLPQPFWLQTSPEFAMKRLLAAGAEAIYQIGPAFRGGEQGEQHNLEFTMLEWYRVGDSYEQGMDRLDEFARDALGCQPARRITYRELFQQLAGVDPLDRQALQAGYAKLVAGETNPHQSVEEDHMLNRIMVDRIEPALREIHSVIVYDWPASQAALARTRRDGDIDVAERFELFVAGVELANGYHELTDAQQLAGRIERVNQLRIRDGRRALPGRSRLMAAMQHGLPGGCGVALGFDRLVMLATGARSITEVMAFPAERA